MTKTKKPRNRAAQDSTLININALKKRVKVLEMRVKQLTVLMPEIRRQRKQ